GPLGIQKLEQLLRRPRLENLVTLGAKQETGETPIHDVVLDQQNLAAWHVPLPRHRLPAIGSVKKNRLPLPRLLSTQSLPPCISTNFLASASPRPVPSGLSALPLVLTWWNSRKMRSCSSTGIPGPVSPTSTRAAASSRSARTQTRPASGVNLMALPTRFSK